MPKLHDKCAECKAMLSPRNPEIPEASLHHSYCSQWREAKLPRERTCCDTKDGMLHRPNCAKHQADVQAVQDPPRPAALSSQSCESDPIGEAARQLSTGANAIRQGRRSITYTKENAPAHDPVNAPAHYTAYSIAAIDVIDSWNLNFRLGSVIKYVSREKFKGGLEDLRKAMWYLNREIELREKEAQGAAGE